MKQPIVFALAALFTLPLAAATRINVADHGILPTPACDASPLVEKLLAGIKANPPEGGVTLFFPKGTYHFRQENAASREWYTSNHDQVNPRRVAFALEGLKDFTLDGGGSDFIIHGRMMEIGALNCANLTLKNFSFDFEQPQITQINIQSVDPAEKSLTFSLLPGVRYTLENGRFTPGRDGWKNQPGMGILFEAGTKRVVQQTADFGLNLKHVEPIGDNLFKASKVNNAARYAPGMMFAARSWERPCPGIFLAECTDTTLRDVTIHYADGMALVAQLCDNIHLDRFNVSLRGKDDPRAFTTQADATHFSGCKGLILSENGLYEGMMDDAINVHGTYLKVLARTGDNTLRARYMHGQAWGFKWGDPGDQVQFIASKTMEITGEPNTVKSIKSLDKPINQGCREFEITFEKPLAAGITPEASIGIENLTWTPSVVFRKNTVRNNRARGALFSTPKPVVIEENFFDHTSGTAILLCGDCNGWYETGACRDVTIRNNRFLNGLTSAYQFTEAVISIYPEIPDLLNQKKYFHSGVVIENNLFETFDRPILYAKSIDGLTFRGNEIVKTEDYKPWHPNTFIFKLDRAVNVVIADNEFPELLDPNKDFHLYESPMPKID